VRDPGVPVADLIGRAHHTVDETLVEEFFPFTVEGLTALKSRLAQTMTPRDITNKMTRSLGRAHRAGSLAITSNVIG
jgi:hypothetical protein